MTKNSTNLQPNFGITLSPQSDICRTPLSTSSSSSSQGVSIISEFDNQAKPFPGLGLKQVHEYNLQDCCEFLQSVQLEEYIPAFTQNKMDGILLSCLVREQIGSQILSSMGITDSNTISVLVNAIKKIVHDNGKSQIF